MSYYTMQNVPAIMAKKLLSQRDVVTLAEAEGIKISLSSVARACQGRPVTGRVARGIILALKVSTKDVILDT